MQDPADHDDLGVAPSQESITVEGVNDSRDKYKTDGTSAAAGPSLSSTPDDDEPIHVVQSIEPEQDDDDDFEPAEPLPTTSNPKNANPVSLGSRTTSSSSPVASYSNIHINVERLGRFRAIVDRLTEKIIRLATSKKYKPLRDKCREASRCAKVVADTATLPEVNEQMVVEAVACAKDALDACLATNKATVIDVALDLYNKLFESGFMGTRAGDVFCLDYKNPKLLPETLDHICETIRSGDETVFLRIVQTVLTAFKKSGGDISGSALLTCVRAVFNINLNAKSTSVRGTAKAAISQIIHQTFASMQDYVFKLQAERAKDNAQPAGGSANDQDVVVMSSAARSAQQSNVCTDAFLIFRSLCKLSAKIIAKKQGDGVPESADDIKAAIADADSHRGTSHHSSESEKSLDVRCRILALELVKLTISTGWKAFPEDDRFIVCLRDTLFPSLITNCLSTQVTIAVAALEVTEEIIIRPSLRPFLKPEVATLLNSVVFRFLEISSAGAHRRKASLRVLYKVCADPQTLTDLFVNYDCDLNSTSIYGKGCEVLSSIVKRLYLAHKQLKSHGAWTTEATPVAVGGVAAPIEGNGTTSTHRPSISQYPEIAFPAAFYENEDEENWKEGLEAIVSAIKSLRNWAQNLEVVHNAMLQKHTSKLTSPASTSIPDPLLVGSGSKRNSTPADKQLEAEAGSKPHSQDATLSENSTEAQGKTRFVEALRTKKLLEEGRARFNAKPKTGIKFLVENKVIHENTPAAIANYFKSSQGLDATILGDYLGEGDPFNIEVMHCYTDTFDFAGMQFDEAIRFYLADFRLPGEAQKIDRVMEKFASCFCKQNEGIFANADTAYILAYSIIMLNTDAHNPQVKNKMTKDGFVRNNRGINDGKDLDPKFLGEIYDRIVRNEIRLSDSVKDKRTADAAKAVDPNASSGSASHEVDPVLRAQMFRLESEKLLSQTRVLFQKGSTGSSQKVGHVEVPYYSASNVQFARLMFEISSDLFLNPVAHILSTEEKDRAMVTLCIEAFEHALAIASLFGMKKEQSLWIAALSRIGIANGQIRSLTLKHVRCLGLIVRFVNDFAREDENAQQERANGTLAFSLVANPGTSGSDLMANPSTAGPEKGIGDDFLDWKSIISAISILQISRACAMGSTERFVLSKHTTMASFFAKKENSSSSFLDGSTASPSLRLGSGEEEAAANRGKYLAIDASAAEAALELHDAEIEFLFSESHNLSIVRCLDICKALTAVGEKELQGKLLLSDGQGDRPHTNLFCLQKIVEVAKSNMEVRTRREWTLIWETFSGFFYRAFLHENEVVAEFCTDVFTLLSKFFMMKEELENYHYQRAFLRPLESAYIAMGNTGKSSARRKHVLLQILSLIKSSAANLRSGWKALFGIIGATAEDRNESTMNSGFRMTETVMESYFQDNPYVFLDAIDGLAAYSRNPSSTSVAMAALSYIGGACVEVLVSRWSSAPFAAAGLSKSKSLSRANSSEYRGVTLFSGSDEKHIARWFPILIALANGLSDDRPAIQAESKLLLFRVLNKYGEHFDADLWSLIYKGVLSPIFDDIRHSKGINIEKEDREVYAWATTTGAQCLMELSLLFVANYKRLKSHLPDILSLLKDWICQNNESIAREGVSSLQAFVTSCCAMLTESEWDMICEMDVELFRTMLPVELFYPFVSASKAQVSEPIVGPDSSRARPSESNDGVAAQPIASASDSKSTEAVEPPSQLSVAISGEKAEAQSTSVSESDLKPVAPEDTKSIDFKVVRTKCVVQLQLIDFTVDTLVSKAYLYLTTKQIIFLVNAMEESFLFAKEFNLNLELRFALWKAGFMNQVPNLLTQEMNGLGGVLRVLFWLYLDRFKDNGVAVKQVEERLFTLCEKILSTFLTAVRESLAPTNPPRPLGDNSSDAPSSTGSESLAEGSEYHQQRSREVPALIPCVLIILEKFCELPPDSFEQSLGLFYDYFMDLLTCENPIIRSSVCRLLRLRIKPLLIWAVGEKKQSQALGHAQSNPVRNESSYLDSIMGVSSNSNSGSAATALSSSSSSRIQKKAFVAVTLPGGLRIVVLGVDDPGQSNREFILASLKGLVSSKESVSSDKSSLQNDVSRTTSGDTSQSRKLPDILGVRYDDIDGVYLVYTRATAEDLLPLFAKALGNRSLQLLSDGRSVIASSY